MVMVKHPHRGVDYHVRSAAGRAPAMAPASRDRYAAEFYTREDRLHQRGLSGAAPITRTGACQTGGHR